MDRFFQIPSPEAAATQPPMLASQRMALLIGNARYDGDALKNPLNDVALLNSSLELLGFETRVLRDADLATMRREINQFVELLDRAPANGVAFFYYAGHGVQHEGRNFLLPTDANVPDAASLDRSAMSLDEIIHSFRRDDTSRATVVVLDACRHDPLKRSEPGEPRLDGLSAINDAPNGSLIAFSTAAGSVAADGDGANSPYAQLLARRLLQSSLKLREVFHSVAEEMKVQSDGRQNPFMVAQVFPGIVLTEDEPAPAVRKWGLVGAVAASTLLACGVIGALHVNEIWRESVLSETVIDRVPWWRASPMQAGHINILIAGLDDDEANQRHAKHIETSLNGQFSATGSKAAVRVRRIIRIVRGFGRDTADQLKNAELRGQRLLEKHNADVLIWGRVARQDRLLRLRFLSRGRGATRDTAYILNQQTLELPQRFGANLGTLLAAQTAAQVSAVYAGGKIDGPALLRIYPKIKRLVAQPPTTFDLQTRAKLLEAFAKASHRMGTLKGNVSYQLEAAASFRQAIKLSDGKNKFQWGRLKHNLGVVMLASGRIQRRPSWLKESLAAFNDAIAVRTRDRNLDEWAATETGIGMALIFLGEHQRDPELIRRAVTVFRDIVKNRDRRRSPKKWAFDNHNLAVALSELGDQEDDQRAYRLAIAEYENTLSVRTREQHPADWSLTKHALGIALYELGNLANDPKLVQKSESAYQDALKVRTRLRFPRKWAITTRHLGNTWLFLGANRRDQKLVEHAIRIFKETLQEQTRQRYPYDWAHTQHTLGRALFMLSNLTSNVHIIDQSLAAYVNALKVRTREVFPASWADTKHSIGLVLLALGRETKKPQFIKKSIVAFEDALKERTRKRVPTFWAETNHRLGSAFNSLANLKGDIALYQRSVEAYELALTVRTRQSHSAEWASTKNSLGITLTLLGEKIGDPELIRKGITAFKDALLERTRDRAPRNWASTKHGLGVALASLGRFEKSTSLAQDSITSYTEALAVRTPDDAPVDWAWTQFAVGQARYFLGKQAKDADELRHSVIAYKNVLQIHTREKFPERWALTKHNLGLSLRLLGTHTKNASLFQEAISAYGDALQVRNREKSPRKWADTQNALGVAWASLAERTHDVRLLRRAVSAYNQALLEYSPLETFDNWMQTKTNLASAWNLVGLRLIKQSDRKGAFEAYAKELKIRKELGDVDPRNVDRQLSLARVHQEFAKLNFERAENADRALAILRRLSAIKRLPLRQSSRISQLLAYKGQYAEALAYKESALAAVEAEDIKKTGQVGAATSSHLGGIAWYALLARKFERAKSASERATRLAPKALWLKTNLAHAMLFLTRTDADRAAATKIYLRHRGDLLPGAGGRTWNEAIADDFMKFRAAGISNPAMANIEAALALPSK